MSGSADARDRKTRMLDTAEIERALADAGYRITPQRRAIVTALAGRHDHPSARQLHRQLEGRIASLSLATVYNTLATLVEVGALVELEFEDDDNRYDTNLTPHLNLVCTACGTILDLAHEPPATPEQIRSRVGFEVTQIRLEYRGLCAACRADAGGEGP